MPIALYTNLKRMPLRQLFQQPEKVIADFVRELPAPLNQFVAHNYRLFSSK